MKKCCLVSLDLILVSGKLIMFYLVEEVVYVLVDYFLLEIEWDKFGWM